MILAIIYGVIKEFFEKLYGKERKDDNDENEDHSEQKKENLNKCPLMSENQNKIKEQGKSE
jgi:hypothetical protein